MEYDIMYTLLSMLPKLLHYFLGLNILNMFLRIIFLAPSITAFPCCDWFSCVYIYIYIQGVPGECTRLRQNVPCVKVHRYNPKHLYPKLNGYGDNGERKVWSSCRFTYCTCFTYCYSYTAHVRPSVSQPSQAHSAFIINRCHSYSEL